MEFVSVHKVASTATETVSTRQTTQSTVVPVAALARRVSFVQVGSALVPVQPNRLTVLAHVSTLKAVTPIVEGVPRPAWVGSHVRMDSAPAQAAKWIAEGPALTLEMTPSIAAVATKPALPARYVPMGNAR